MKDNVFIDTNILLYLYSSSEHDKKEIIKNIINSNEIIISLQVVNEFCNVCFKKFKYSVEIIEISIKDFEKNFKIYDYSLKEIKNSLFIKNKYSYSFYDSLIISSSLSSNCKILYSEDMQHNQIIENKLKIINPFV